MAVKSYIIPADLREAVASLKSEGRKVGLVPTMGALHDGHLSLFKELSKSCDSLVASIFVNPKQFGPGEDFSTYPRTIKDDLAKLESVGVDAVFIPNANDIYPDGFQTFLTNEEMSSVLCGKYRPGHFQGVLTIVLKLLNMVQPDVAIFGRKDYQQYQIIKAMVRDLCVPVEVIGGSIIREEDGLAMSSRNIRIKDEHREQASLLYKGLRSSHDLFATGCYDVGELVDNFQEHIKSTEFKLQYAEIRSQKHLREFESEVNEAAVFAVAAYLGDVRLIDNIELGL